MVSLSLTAAKQTCSLLATKKLPVVFFKMHHHQNKAKLHSNRGQLDFVIFKIPFITYKLRFTLQAPLALSHWISFLVGNFGHFSPSCHVQFKKSLTMGEWVGEIKQHTAEMILLEVAKIKLCKTKTWEHNPLWCLAWGLDSAFNSVRPHMSLESQIKPRFGGNSRWKYV